MINSDLSETEVIAQIIKNKVKNTQSLGAVRVFDILNVADKCGFSVFPIFSGVAQYETNSLVYAEGKNVIDFYKAVNELHDYRSPNDRGGGRRMKEESPADITPS